MALDFYAFSPPEAVPDYLALEAMPEATFLTLPWYYVEWIGITLDQLAGEVDGTYRTLDAEVEIWEHWLPDLTSEAPYAITRKDRDCMRGVLQRINRQRERVAARIWALRTEAQQTVSDPAAPLTAPALVATLSDLMGRFVAEQQDYLPFLRGLGVSLGHVLARLVRQEHLLPDEVDAALDSTCHMLRTVTVECICAAYQQPAGDAPANDVRR
jgi:hypothetical protein